MSQRDNVSNVGIGPLTATYKIDNSTITYDETEANGAAEVGLAVTFSDDDTVELVGDGEPVVGKLLQVFADNMATVQIGGVVTLPGGASATLTRGNKIVGDLGAGSAEGYIRDGDGSTAAEIQAARGQIQNIADTTAVVVKL